MATLSARIKLLALSIGADIKKLKADYAGLGSAASREVGTKNGNVPVYTVFGLSNAGYSATASQSINYDDITTPTGFYRSIDTTSPNAPINQWVNIQRQWFNADQFTEFAIGRNIAIPQRMWMRVVDLKAASKFGAWTEFYTTSNTKLGPNGELRPSSPVLEIYHDKMIANQDGERMDATFTKNGVGDYTITGTTGLRDDGWYVVIPNDMNGNPKVAITLEDIDGVITLKTYVRIFDMTTFKFVPDLEQPLDIPDGRWIDLRFNDLPIDESVDMPANNEE